jgi:hypothetical protein
VGRSLQRWEAARGNPMFRAPHLARLIDGVGFELAAVYASLREQFPAARPDVVDFSVSLPRDVLGVTYTYGDLLPSVRRLAPSSPAATSPMTVREAWEQGVLTVGELRRADGVRDVTATGCVELTGDFSTVRGYAKVAAEAAANEVRRVLRGMPPQPPFLASIPTTTLIHEFGHLAEAALADRGFDAVEEAFAELSTVLFGGRPPSPGQWRYHLVNYPALPGSLAGPHQGGAHRQGETRRALRRRIGEKLGRYASLNRDELFAESFTYALVGDAELRESLAPFLASIRRNLGPAPI